MIPIEIIFSSLALILSLLSVIFIALPYRNSLKPKLMIEIKDGYDTETQNYVVYKNPFLSITNISNNTAENIEVKLISYLEVKEINYKKRLENKEEIIYLHPKEISIFPLKIIPHLIKKEKDLFEIKKNKSCEIIVPKNDLVIKIKIKIYSKMYKTYDDFYLIWYSMKSLTNFDSPRILCWNKRKDKYIIKNRKIKI